MLDIRYFRVNKIQPLAPAIKSQFRHPFKPDPVGDIVFGFNTIRIVRLIIENIPCFVTFREDDSCGTKNVNKSIQLYLDGKPHGIQYPEAIVVYALTHAEALKLETLLPFQVNVINFSEGLTDELLQFKTVYVLRRRMANKWVKSQLGEFGIIQLTNTPRIRHAPDVPITKGLRYPVIIDYTWKVMSWFKSASLIFEIPTNMYHHCVVEQRDGSFLIAHCKKRLMFQSQFRALIIRMLGFGELPDTVDIHGKLLEKEDVVFYSNTGKLPAVMSPLRYNVNNLINIENLYSNTPLKPNHEYLVFSTHGNWSRRRVATVTTEEESC